MGILPSFQNASSVDAEKQRLKAGLEGTDQSVQACRSIDDATRASWGSFYMTTLAFCNEASSTWSAASEMDTAQSYEAQLGAWQERLGTAGCKLSTPPINPPKPPDPTMEALKWIAISAGVVAGTVTVTKIIEALELFKSAPKPAELKPKAAAEPRPQRMKYTVWWRNPDHKGQWEIWGSGLSHSRAEKTAAIARTNAASWFGHTVPTSVTPDGVEPSMMGTHMIFG